MRKVGKTGMHRACYAALPKRGRGELQPLWPACYWLDRRSPGSGCRCCISEAGVQGAAGELWLHQTTGAPCKSASSKGLGRARQLAFEGHGKFPPPSSLFSPPYPAFLPSSSLLHHPYSKHIWGIHSIKSLSAPAGSKVKGQWSSGGRIDARRSWSWWLPLTLSFVSLHPPPHLAHAPHFFSTYHL